jgi:UPF0271 protein
VSLDLNCDLGEGEVPEVAAALMAHVTSANIACGGHAGDDASIRRCLTLAGRHGVRVGAHPGLADRAGFGRAPSPLDPEGLRALLRPQIRRFLELCAEANLAPSHIKLHGALYHMTEADPALRAAHLDFCAKEAPGLTLYALAGGRVAAEARERGLSVWGEAFLDRGYRADGSLIPRGQPGAMLGEWEALRARLAGLRERGEIVAADGSRVAVNARTLCLHGDGPNAVEWAKAARQWLAGPGLSSSASA